MNDKPSNPWDVGLMIASVLIILLGGLSVLGLLFAMALGVDLSGGPEVSGQTYAIFLLSVFAVLMLVFAMAARWNAKHRRRS